MPMSQSASSSPTPRSTSRVMMTGLMALTSGERTVGLVHPRRPAQDLSYGILPKNLAYPTDGRVRTLPHLSRAAHVLWSFLLIRDRHARPDTAYGAVTPSGSPANATNASRDTDMRDCSARAAPYRE